MSQTKHTEGPWNTPEHMSMRNGDYIIRESEYQEPIARVCAGIDAGKANAHLMAAAPDMFAALEAITETGKGKSDSENMMNAKRALNKARGIS